MDFATFMDFVRTLSDADFGRLMTLIQDAGLMDDAPGDSSPAPRSLGDALGGADDGLSFELNATSPEARPEGATLFYSARFDKGGDFLNLRAGFEGAWDYMDELVFKGAEDEVRIALDGPDAGTLADQIESGLEDQGIAVAGIAHDAERINIDFA